MILKTNPGAGIYICGDITVALCTCLVDNYVSGVAIALSASSLHCRMNRYINLNLEINIEGLRLI